MIKIMLVLEDYHTSFDLMIVNLLLKCRFKVFLFASEKKLSHFSDFEHNVKLLIAPEKTGNGHFAKFIRCREYSNRISTMADKENIDVIMVTTAQNIYVNLFLASVLKKAISILVVHNVNRFVVWGDRVFRSMERNFETYPLWRKIINSRVARSANALVVLTDYLQEKMSRLVPSIPVYELPFRISSSEVLTRRKESVLNNSVTTFTISGSVSGKRRTYDRYFELFGGLANTDFRLVLLGEVRDPTVVRRGKELLGDKLITFDRFLTEEEYLSELLSSHFLITDLSKSMPYGVFKASGVEFDGPSLGIPVILPEDVLKSSRHGVFIRFSEDNLKHILRNAIGSVEDGTYEKEYLEPAIAEAEYFDESKWADILYNIITTSLKTASVTRTKENWGDST